MQVTLFWRFMATRIWFDGAAVWLQYHRGAVEPVILARAHSWRRTSALGQATCKQDDQVLVPKSRTGTAAPHRSSSCPHAVTGYLRPQAHLFTGADASSQFTFAIEIASCSRLRKSNAVSGPTFLTRLGFLAPAQPFISPGGHGSDAAPRCGYAWIGCLGAKLWFYFSHDRNSRGSCENSDGVVVKGRTEHWQRVSLQVLRIAFTRQGY